MVLRAPDAVPARNLRRTPRRGRPRAPAGWGGNRAHELVGDSRATRPEPGPRPEGSLRPLPRDMPAVVVDPRIASPTGAGGARRRRRLGGLRVARRVYG